jgi:predicted small integral membrane protein
MGWMYWTPPTAFFFVVLALVLSGMTVWEIRSPSVARRGWLPLITTRGDRLFLGLVAIACTNLAWTGLTDAAQWYGCGLSLVVFVPLFRWG